MNTIIVYIAISGEELKEICEGRENLMSVLVWKIFEVTGDIKNASFTER